MKMFSKSPFLMLAMLATFACSKTEPDPSPGDVEDVYVKAVMHNANGTTEETRIKYLKYDPWTGAPLRVLTNIQVHGEMTLNDGDYGVIEIFEGANLYLDGVGVVGNMNFNNNGHHVEIHTYGQWRVQSSLNLNGGVFWYQNATLYSGNVELQGSNKDFATDKFHNWFENIGNHYVTGDIQATNEGCVYKPCGVTYVTNYTNIHAGTIDFCRCGQLITYGLNVNRANGVTGEGFLKVQNSLNLNHNLTESDKIIFCYTGNINQPEKVGSAKRSCDPDCPSLPLRFVNLEWKTVKGSERVEGEISFDVTENSDFLGMEVLVSRDGKTWAQAMVEKSDAFVVGKKYTGRFPLPKKNTL